MEIQTSDKSKIPLVQLALPMFIENIIRTSLISVDQLMFFYYSNKAVAAMAVVNVMAFFIQIIYFMVGIGASIHISQNLGAGNKNEAKLVSLASIVLISIFAGVLSIIMVFSASGILGFYPVEQEVRQYAWDFLVIFSGGSIFMAINIVQSSILRSYGRARIPMIANVISLLFAIGGNALCLFGFFGFPVLGVKGVASVTVLSQVLVFIILGICIFLNKEINLPYRDILKIPVNVYIKILKVGVPTAGENLSYNIGQMIISWMISGMGTAVLNAFSLVITLSRYVFISSLSIGSGTQIKVGYYVGSQKSDEAYKKVYRYFVIGFAVTFIMIIMLNIFKNGVIKLFTKDEEIIKIASAVLLVSIFLETGRNFNLIIIPGLKGAGDFTFPVIIGIIFMWGVGVGGAFLLGVVFKMGLLGIWIAVAMDEWTRGIIMLFRWKSGAWKNKSLVVEKTV